MGLGRAMLFGSMAAIPGVVLALIGWAIIGAPDEEWENAQWIACYLPFFGCVAAGLVMGWRHEAPGVED